MGKFSLGGCHVLWFKKAKVPKRDRQAIIADLGGISHLIEEAMNYTKERYGRETTIRFSLKVGEKSPSYFLQICFEPGMNEWSVALYRIQNTQGFPEDFVGELVSEKWSFGQMFYDDDYKTPENI